MKRLLFLLLSILLLAPLAYAGGYEDFSAFNLDWSGGNNSRLAFYSPLTSTANILSPPRAYPGTAATFSRASAQYFTVSALGVPVDEKAEVLEGRIGRVCTPELIAKNGDRIMTIVLSKEEAALLPDVAAPDFLTDWRSDEVDEEGNLLPWPEYEIPAPEGWPKEAVSEDGKTSTPCVYRQGAGRISGE